MSTFKDKPLKKCHTDKRKMIDDIHNNITDEQCEIIFNILRLSPYMKELSISNNDIIGEKSLESLSNLLIGNEFSPEEEAIYKNMTKLVNDKNKNIKDINKGRKKAGKNELIELNVPLERIDNGNMSNRTIQAIDMSNNPINIIYYNNFINYIQNIENHKFNSATNSELNLNLIVRGTSAATSSSGVEAESEEAKVLLAGLTVIA